MATSIVTEAIVNMIFTVLIVIAIIPIYNNWRENKNRFSRSFMIIMLLYILDIQIRLSYASFVLLDGTDIIFGADLSIWYILDIFGIFIYLSYFVYLYNKRKLYSVVLYFSVLMTYILYLGDNFIYLTSFYLLVAFVSIFFIYKGLKNRDGVILSFGILTLIDYFQFYIVEYSSIIYFQVVAFIGIIIVILGTSGFIDEKILYDREKEKEAKNNWVSMILTKEGKNDNKYHSKNLVIMCPICKHQELKVFSASDVEKRSNNPKGIVKILIHQYEVCDHTFMAYMDKNFMIRGYETVDITL